MGSYVNCAHPRWPWTTSTTTPPPAVRDNWDLLATSVAQAVATGGGAPQGSLATFVVAVISHHGHGWLPLHHSSIGGQVFRDQFVHGSLADLLGAAAADHLLSRPIAGLAAEEFPAWGHLTADEVAAVAERRPGGRPGTPGRPRPPRRGRRDAPGRQPGLGHRHHPHLTARRGPWAQRSTPPGRRSVAARRHDGRLGQGLTGPPPVTRVRGLDTRTAP